MHDLTKKETRELQQQQANPLFQLKAVPLFNEQTAKKTENQRLGETFYSDSNKKLFKRRKQDKINTM